VARRTQAAVWIRSDGSAEFGERGRDVSVGACFDAEFVARPHRRLATAFTQLGRTI
jgi:hypothetical protein